MAIVNDNTLTKGISGLIGKDLLFQNRNGNTYVYKKFRIPTKWSTLQKDNRTRFAMASSFEKEVIKDPKKKEEYNLLAKKMALTNAYTAALTEYMRKPSIGEPDITSYQGKEGDAIRTVVYKKDFEVESVEIAIINDRGVIVESGKAIRNRFSDWNYNVAVNTEEMNNLKILIKAYERTGNYVVRSCMWKN